MTETEEIQIEGFAIRDITIDVIGITPYSPSRQVQTEKLKSEDWETYEARTWRQKAHVDENNIIFLPGDAFKLSLDEATQNLNEKIPGKGNQTYTGIMKMGVAAISDMSTGVKLDDVLVEKVFCHSGGKRVAGATRVMRWFPILHQWGGSITLRVFNDNLTEAKFEEFFHKAGLIAGVGRGRPSTGCPRGNGRFRPLSFDWVRVS